MNRSLVVALSVVSLDSMGLGLVMPVLPTLLRELVPIPHVAGHYGVLLSLYALMQVIFAPLLGHLSDIYGRRPILLASLCGAAIDYAVMALAPVLWVLYIGRIVSGITGATGSVAASMIADSTNEESRVQWFGYLGACYGAGMIGGPALGGALGAVSAHVPFFAAALLNCVAFALARCVLQESRHEQSTDIKFIKSKALGMFRLNDVFRNNTKFFLVFFLIQLIGQIPAALWVIYGEDRFKWDSTTVGMSLAAFGIAHAIFQAFVAGPLSNRLGERRTLLVAMIADATGFTLLAFAKQGWMVFPILLLLAAGGVGIPSLQALLSRDVLDNNQGALQGTLTSLTNISSILGPLGFTLIYSVTAATWTGLVWIIGTAIYLVCLSILVKCFSSST